MANNTTYTLTYTYHDPYWPVWDCRVRTCDVKRTFKKLSHALGFAADARSRDGWVNDAILCDSSSRWTVYANRGGRRRQVAVIEPYSGKEAEWSAAEGRQSLGAWDA